MIVYSKETILKFYKIIEGVTFETITEERKKQIDNIADNYRVIFTKKTYGKTTLMTYTAERLITSYKNFELATNDEKAYFYVKIIDPDFILLEAYECTNLIKELQTICLKQFGIFDMTLIKLEKSINNRFNIFNPDDLWVNGFLKRELNKKI